MINYFKQAWNLIRQEKLFSSIYIVGTGLSITVVMVLSIVFYIKIANIYPETNRDRMLVVKSVSEKREGGWSSSGGLSMPFIENCLKPVASAEVVSVGIYLSFDEFYVQPEGSNQQLPVVTKYTDHNFWKVFDFRFIEGAPFTEADVQSGIRTAVISASLAQQLFGSDDAVGRYVSMNFNSYRVCGVVKDASFVTGTTYAHLWIPVTVSADFQHSLNPLLGRMAAYVLAPSAGEVEKVRQEILERVEQYTRQFPESEISILGQPDKHWQSVFRFFSNTAPDFTKIARQYGLVFLVLLLVPAISLSGMTDSRMERRIAEMGVRRAFGAPQGKLLRQVLMENFCFTLLGGLVGFVASYVLIVLSGNWIMSIGQTFASQPLDGEAVIFSPAMFLNLPVFCVALGVCFVLNFLSAFIPAWRASKREIIYSLNQHP